MTTTRPAPVRLGTVTAAAEERHTPAADGAWKEAHFAALADDAVSLYYEVGETPAAGRADAFCGLLLDDGSLVFVRRRAEIADPRTGTAVAVGGFELTCAEPLASWSLRYAGPARRYAEPRDLLTGAGYASVAVEIDLRWEAIAAPVLIEGGMTPGIYEQPVRARGRVDVGDRVVRLDTVGYRNHTWGARTWAPDKTWIAAHATGHDGSWAASFVHSRVAGAEQCYGWFRDADGVVRPITAVQPQHQESQPSASGLPGYHLEIDGIPGTVVARMEDSRHVPLRHREGGHVASIDEHLGEWCLRHDGGTYRGPGLLELLQVQAVQA